MSESVAGSVNVFSLDGPTATGEGLLWDAASLTVETARGLNAGFDLQARFEGAVDAKLTDAVHASFRGSGRRRSARRRRRPAWPVCDIPDRLMCPGPTKLIDDQGNGDRCRDLPHAVVQTTGMGAGGHWGW